MIGEGPGRSAIFNKGSEGTLKGGFKRAESLNNADWSEGGPDMSG